MYTLIYIHHKVQVGELIWKRHNDQLQEFTEDPCPPEKDKPEAMYPLPPVPHRDVNSPPVPVPQSDTALPSTSDLAKQGTGTWGRGRADGDVGTGTRLGDVDSGT